MNATIIKTIVLIVSFATIHSSRCDAASPEVLQDVAAVGDGELMIASPESHNLQMLGSVEPNEKHQQEDRIWVVSTRHLTNNTCQANLSTTPFVISRIHPCGVRETIGLDEYQAALSPDRQVVVYVHGNRMDRNSAVYRGLRLYNSVRHRLQGPIDWVVFSWPSEATSCLIGDARRKAARTDAHALYLSLFLRRHASSSVPVTVIGFSFGARLIFGSLHAMAGGSISSRCLPGDHLIGANIKVGLVAPAINADWVAPGGRYGLATQNLQHLLLMYNSRDVLLRNHWRLNRERGSPALGYIGATRFPGRVDGSCLPVRAIDCAPAIGYRHGEVNYFESKCGMGREMTCLINQESVPNVQVCR